AAGGYPDFCHGLSGVKEGSRVAMLFPASLSHNSKASQDGTLAADDSIVYVLDLIKVYPNKASGAEQAAQDGFPVVVRAADGTPGLTQLKSAAPTEFKLATLIKGNGAVVKENQKVTVQYSGFVWGGDKFDSSWDRQAPSQFQLSKGSVIDGFVKAIAGQTIGSQVIAVIPPAEGYGSQEQSGIPANSTLIFVIDILGAN
ncbi:MAG: FKBP-type peptidyl-prolyl cis-trans isomerase, partial [Rhodoluna sp.]